MGTPPTPWRRRVHELLGDGEWHEQDPVVQDAMRLVPPGPAYRHAEMARRNKPTAPPVRVKGNEADAIASGQRQLVMQTIYAGIRFGSFDRKKEDGKFYLRDLTIGKRPRDVPEVDDLVECLKRQLTYWERAKRHLPKGDARAVILAGDPAADILKTLRKNGRM